MVKTWMGNAASPEDIMMRMRSGAAVTPQEIEVMKQLLGEAPTEDSPGFWDAGNSGNGMGRSLINLPNDDGSDPFSYYLDGQGPPALGPRLFDDAGRAGCDAASG